MYKRFLIISMVTILSICCVPIFTSAATSTTIEYPAQYSEVFPNTSLTIRWSPPSSGTVSSYCLTVIKEKVKEVTYYTYLVNDMYLSASTTSYTLNANSIVRDGLYTIILYAIMSDGSMNWASSRSFYVATHKGVPSGTTLSLKIYTGLPYEYKEATYYATRTWIDELGIEKINTYPYNQGTNTATYNNYDNINTVIPINNPDSADIMTTYCRVATTGDNYVREVDITVNEAHSFSTSGSTNTYDFLSSMTHEIGHALGLTDKYESFAENWTMCGYSYTGDIRRRSLEHYDIKAAKLLYYSQIELSLQNTDSSEVTAS